MNDSEAEKLAREDVRKHVSCDESARIHDLAERMWLAGWAARGELLQKQQASDASSFDAIASAQDECTPARREKGHRFDDKGECHHCGEASTQQVSLEQAALGMAAAFGKGAVKINPDGSVEHVPFAALDIGRRICSCPQVKCECASKAGKP